MSNDHDPRQVMDAALEEIFSGSRFYTERGPGKPRLLVMSGLPMSGKSHLANMVRERMGGRVNIVRTDEFRPVIARHMGRKQPQYDVPEHELVFGAGREMVGRSLENGWSTIADATNLTEEHRRWALDPARNVADQVLVVFMKASDATAMDRSRTMERSGSAATPAVYALLKYEKEPVDRCTAPYLQIDSETDVTPWAVQLARWLSGETNRVAGTVIPRRR